MTLQKRQMYGQTSGGTETALLTESNGAMAINDPALACATPTEYNVTLTNANQEYSQALPTGARKVIFRCRSVAECRYAWVTGKVAGPTAPYQTLKSGAEYATDGVNLTGKTLYLASATAGVVVEIEVWQ